MHASFQPLLHHKIDSHVQPSSGTQQAHITKPDVNLSTWLAIAGRHRCAPNVATNVTTAACTQNALVQGVGQPSIHPSI
jgi:hypothetical protein